jgi:hypothetical protein
MLLRRAPVRTSKEYKVSFLLKNRIQRGKKKKKRESVEE